MERLVQEEGGREGARETGEKKSSSDFNLQEGQKASHHRLYPGLARSFLCNHNIPLHPENLFKAEVLFQIIGNESGQIRVSALKVLLDWGGYLKGKGKGEMEEDASNLSQQDALRLICNNLMEIGITKEQMEKWMS